MKGSREKKNYMRVQEEDMGMEEEFVLFIIMVQIKKHIIQNDDSTN